MNKCSNASERATLAKFSTGDDDITTTRRYDMIYICIHVHDCRPAARGENAQRAIKRAFEELRNILVL